MSSSHRLRLALGAALALGVLVTPLAVEGQSYTGEYPFGTPATQADIDAWNKDVRPDGVTLYTPTQAQTDSQKTAAKITGLPLTSVQVVTTFAGGGFGRRGETGPAGAQRLEKLANTASDRCDQSDSGDDYVVDRSHPTCVWAR